MERLSEQFMIPGKLYKTKRDRSYHQAFFPEEGNVQDIPKDSYVLFITSQNYLNYLSWKACIVLYKNKIHWWGTHRDNFNKFCKDLYVFVQ